MIGFLDCAPGNQIDEMNVVLSPPLDTIVAIGLSMVMVRLHSMFNWISIFSINAQTI